jgi:hypothetical protein
MTALALFLPLLTPQPTTLCVTAVACEPCRSICERAQQQRRLMITRVSCHTGWAMARKDLPPTFLQTRPSTSPSLLSPSQSENAPVCLWGCSGCSTTAAQATEVSVSCDSSRFPRKRGGGRAAQVCSFISTGSRCQLVDYAILYSKSMIRAWLRLATY